MKKIYNNLTVENLVKTEWFNQFDEAQQDIIREGLYQGLDVSIYAKPEFDYSQMSQIVYGLENNVDVSKYAIIEFDWDQME